MLHRWTCIAVLPLKGLCWRTCAAFPSDQDFLHATRSKRPSRDASTRATLPALLARDCNDTP